MHDSTTPWHTKHMFLFNQILQIFFTQTNIDYIILNHIDDDEENLYNT